MFQHTKENNVGEQIQHKTREWSIPNEYTSLVLKNSVLAVQYLHFTLISMETELL